MTNLSFFPLAPDNELTQNAGTLRLTIQSFSKSSQMACNTKSGWGKADALLARKHGADIP